MRSSRFRIFRNAPRHQPFRWQILLLPTQQAWAVVQLKDSICIFFDYVLPVQVHPMNQLNFCSQGEWCLRNDAGMFWISSTVTDIAVIPQSGTFASRLRLVSLRLDYQRRVKVSFTGFYFCTARMPGSTSAAFTPYRLHRNLCPALANDKNLQSTDHWKRLFVAYQNRGRHRGTRAMHLCNQRPANSSTAAYPGSTV